MTSLKKQDGEISGDVSYKLINSDTTTSKAMVRLAIYEKASRKLVYYRSNDWIFPTVGKHPVEEHSGGFTGVSVSKATAAGYTVKLFCWHLNNEALPLAPIKFDI